MYSRNYPDDELEFISDEDWVYDDESLFSAEHGPIWDEFFGSKILDEDDHGMIRRKNKPWYSVDLIETEGFGSWL